MTNTTKVEENLLTSEEALKCDLLYDVLQGEVGHCFNLAYRDDLTFEERVNGFRNFFEEYVKAPVHKFFEDYGDDFFSEPLQEQFDRYKAKHLHRYKLTIAFIGYEVMVEVLGYEDTPKHKLFNKAINQLKQRGFSFNEEVSVEDVIEIL